MTDIKETLRTLTEASGPSGYETDVTAAAMTLLRPYCDEVSADTYGNLIGIIRCGAENAKSVLLDAHLDEVGLMVTAEDKGFYSFAPIGAIDPAVMPGAEIVLQTPAGKVQAVVACLPPHVMKEGDADKLQQISELYLDTGGVSVPVGTVGHLRGETGTLGPLLCGRSFDDRACFATLLRALDHIERDKLCVDVIILGSTREETGGQGAAAAAFRLDPDWAVAVDVSYGLSHETSANESFPLGGGVIIDHGIDCNRKVAAALRELARAKEIPHQISVDAEHSGTNATAMQTVRGGVRTSVLSLPLRYMHTAVETAHPDDMENLAKLLGEWVTTLC